MPEELNILLRGYNKYGTRGDVLIDNIGEYYRCYRYTDMCCLASSIIPCEMCKFVEDSKCDYYMSKYILSRISKS